MLHVTHLDDLPSRRWTYGPIDGVWSYVATERQGGLPARNAGCRRCRIPASATPVPVHQHLGAEEVFHVLAGDGFAYELDGDGERSYAVRAGDLIVRRANMEAHALVAGPAGLDVIAFGPSAAPRAEVFPRIGVTRLRERWVEVDVGGHPWEREAALPPLTLPPPTAARPPWYVHRGDVPLVARNGSAIGDLGTAAGAVECGIHVVRVDAAATDGPRRAHSIAERLLLVQAGDGVAVGDAGRHPLRVGSVVLALAGTGAAWQVEAGADGLDLLEFATRDPADIAYLPDSGEALISALGVVVPARTSD